MLGRHLQVPADVVLGQLGQVLGRFLGEVHPDAGRNQDRIDARHLAALSHQVDRAGRGRLSRSLQIVG